MAVRRGRGARPEKAVEKPRGGCDRASYREFAGDANRRREFPTVQWRQRGLRPAEAEYG